MASADCLVLLSDVDGLYTADPNKDPGAQFIAQVPQITAQIEAMAGRPSSDVVPAHGRKSRRRASPSEPDAIW
jgi:glutamate 5-kinase